jgi:hypothetical protein
LRMTPMPIHLLRLTSCQRIRSIHTTSHQQVSITESSLPSGIDVNSTPNGDWHSTIPGLDKLFHLLVFLLSAYLMNQCSRGRKDNAINFKSVV